MKTAFVPAAFLCSLTSGLAFAQAPAAPPKPPAAATAPAAPAGSASPAVAAEPALPTVDDPMLTPPPPAAQLVTSWRQAIDLVRRRSTTLRTSLARVDVAAAQARQVLAASLPRLDADAGVNHHLLRRDVTDPSTGLRVTIPAPATPWSASLNLRVPVFAPAAWNEHGTALDAVDSLRLSTKETERLIVAGVADAIVSVVTAERLAEVTRGSLMSSLSTLDLNKRRAALGASSQLDVLRAEQDVQAARLLALQRNEALLKAREALGSALGSSQGYGVTTDIRLDALAADAQTVCRPERDVGKRPDVLAASAEVALAERRKDGVDWTFWPTVDAVSSFGIAGPAPGNLGEYPTWTVGGVLNWALYDGGARYGKREEFEASTRVAREQLTDTKRRAELEVTQSVRAVQVAAANLAVSGRAREIAAETARLAKVAFMNGSGTSFDLVDTARRQREAELDFAIGEFDLLRARVAALLALASCKV